MNLDDDTNEQLDIDGDIPVTIGNIVSEDLQRYIRQVLLSLGFSKSEVLISRGVEITREQGGILTPFNVSFRTGTEPPLRFEDNLFAENSNARDIARGIIYSCYSDVRRKVEALCKEQHHVGTDEDEHPVFTTHDDDSDLLEMELDLDENEMVEREVASFFRRNTKVKVLQFKLVSSSTLTPYAWEAYVFRSSKNLAKNHCRILRQALHRRMQNHHVLLVMIEGRIIRFCEFPMDETGSFPSH